MFWLAFENVLFSIFYFFFSQYTDSLRNMDTYFSYNNFTLFYNKLLYYTDFAASFYVYFILSQDQLEKAGPNCTFTF